MDDDDDDGEEIEELAEDEKSRDELLNVRISKTIDGQLCSGTVTDVVVGHRTQERLYLIEYLDGDIEHMTGHEVRAGLLSWVTQDAAEILPERPERERDHPTDVIMEREEEAHEEAIEALPDDEKAKDVLLYGRITKRMDGKAFSGTIVDVAMGMNTRERLYLIRYFDGDMEHMTESEAMEALAAWADADAPHKPAGDAETADETRS